MTGRLLCILALCHFFVSVYGQKATLTGTVVSALDSEALIGVNIIVNERQGAATDINGRYEITLNPGRYQLEVRFIGYKTQFQQVQLKADETITLHFSLEEQASELNTVVVTSSRYEKSLFEESVTIEVVKPEFVERVSSQTLADALQRINGVNVLDRQINIRGGSGYSYGVGSRVMMIVDDMPLLSGDRSDIKWNYLPMEHLEQIEVIKGPSSVLYGSAALNGVVHVRTLWPREESETRVMLMQNFMESPRRKEMVWWDGYPPFGVQGHFSHAQRFEKMDFVLGGAIRSQTSHLMGVYDHYARTNWKTRYRHPRIKGLTMGLNGSFMYNAAAEFFFWENDTTGALKPFAGNSTIQTNRNIFLNIDPWVTYFDRFSNKHEVKFRYYLNKQGLRNAGSTYNDLKPMMYLADYKMNRNLANNLVFTLGGSGFFFTIRDGIFGHHDGYFLSAFGQLEKKWGLLSASAGGRVEMFSLDKSSSDPVPVFKGGLNYQAAEKTFVRASGGQGFRFPSIAERFVDTNLEAINFFPNPNLQPEKGWNVELGLKQSYKIGKFTGFTDIAFFWTEYKNMVEFVFDLHLPDSLDGELPVFGSLAEFESFLTQNVGFKSLNLEKARINGFEVTNSGDLNLKNFRFSYMLGYTFINPIDIRVDSTLKWYTLADTTTVLKYRFRHTLKTDLDFQYKNISWGVNYQLLSHVERIDEIFEGGGQWGDLVVLVLGSEPIPGLAGYRRRNKGPQHVLDVRMGYQITKSSRLSLIVKNALNQEYAYRPALLEAPRNYTLQYNYVF